MSGVALTGVLVVLGGAVGAPVRYLVDRWVAAGPPRALPWGTIAVNVVGSFVLGMVMGAGQAGSSPAWLAPLVGSGFCGALTTFSTFSLETIQLLTEGRWRAALVNVGLSLTAGLAAASGGWCMAATLRGPA